MATGVDAWEKLKETRSRLEKCWKMDINWSLYPETIRNVRNIGIKSFRLEVGAKHRLEVIERTPMN